MLKHLTFSLKPKAIHKYLINIYYLNMMDLISTLFALGLGMYEQNPFAKILLNKSIVGFILVLVIKLWFLYLYLFLILFYNYVSLNSGDIQIFF